MVRKDQLTSELVHRIEPDEPYFRDLSERWSEALRLAHTNIPRPPYAPPPLLAPALKPKAAGGG